MKSLTATQSVLLLGGFLILAMIAVAQGQPAANPDPALPVVQAPQSASPWVLATVPNGDVKLGCPRLPARSRDTKKTALWKVVSNLLRIVF